MKTTFYKEDIASKKMNRSWRSYYKNCGGKELHFGDELKEKFYLFITSGIDCFYKNFNSEKKGF